MLEVCQHGNEGLLIHSFYFKGAPENAPVEAAIKACRTSGNMLVLFAGGGL